MASNSFGQLFRITTFGESHGKGIGVVIDGCPAGVPITQEEIQLALDKRRPGRSAHTSPRKEEDQVEILSGIFEQQTTGAPIALFIHNHDAHTAPYDSVKEIYRPGHAAFTYWKKYQIFDYRGGGRASARETAARVAAGAIATKLLSLYDITCLAFLSEAASIAISHGDDIASLRAQRDASALFCPDERASAKIIEAIDAIKKERDSIGGIVTGMASLPAGLGEPLYCKLEALLAFAMLSLPASKGFEIGCGFAAARMRGSCHNDPFTIDQQGNVHTTTNHSGGTLGGISTGSSLLFRVPFKPTSSIGRPQESVTLKGEKTTFMLPENSRHDPCVAIRAVPVVEAMTALVLADALLMHRTHTLISDTLYQTREINAY